MHDAHDSTTTLHALLDRGLALHPEYGGGLANHLPMALHALYALGGDAERLRAWDARHRARLQPRAADAAADAFEARHAAMASALARDGRDAVLRRELPGSMAGVAASAFHGLIRTAHAVAAGHDGELAMGLAYWSHRHLPLLAPQEPSGGDLPLSRWLAELQALRPGREVSGRLITGRMRAWAAEPSFAAIAPHLRLERDTLGALADAAARLYAATEDFTVLHMVTACHALLTLWPWLDEPAAALRSFSVAAAVALCASQARGDAAPAAARQWSVIVPLALASEDEHIVKLTYAARGLESAFGGEAFRAAATRATAASEVTA